VSAAVVGVLVLASALGNGSRDEVPAGNSSALPSATAAPAVPAAVEPSPGTTSAVPVAAAVEPAARSTAQARPPAPATSKPTASKSTTSKPTASKSAPPEARAAPKPAPKPAPVAAQAASNCHPSYSPCLPDGPDLDCGDIDGQVTVKGPDEYRLDADDDGTGCDSN
jgi:hypothetical protein